MRRGEYYIPTLESGRLSRSNSKKKGRHRRSSTQAYDCLWVMHKLKGNVGAFFFLLQTEDGDLFKVNIEMTEDEDGKATGEVRRLKIKYFDTVPVSTR